MTSNLEWMNRLSVVECQDATYRPKTHPLVFAQALGSIIIDAEGKEYIDLCAGFGALALGHNSAALKAVLARHLNEALPPVDHAMGDVYPSEEKIKFLETMKGMLPSQFCKGALALSGGQAIETALKTAILYTGNAGFIVFEGGYHGLDLGVLPLTAREDFRGPFKAWTAERNVIRVPYGATREVMAKAAAALAHVGLAAVVVEPIQGRAGIHLPPTDWLLQVRDVAEAYGGLLILDEIFTGFGRTGSVTRGADVDADLVCFGKAIGGGFPVSACFGKKEIMDAWPESRGEALHTGTFFGHPFAASVGRQTLKILSDENLIDKARVVGQWLREELALGLKPCPYFQEIRGEGLMVGVEFSEKGYAAKLMDDLRLQGVIVLPSGATGSTLSITPALNISENLLSQAVDRICRAAIHKT